MRNHLMIPQVKPWHGWYFEEDYFCNPGGNRFTPLFLESALYFSQFDHFRQITYGGRADRFHYQ